MSSHHFPDNIRVRDFGIRSYDLAYALLDGYALTILVDAAPRGDPPGTLYVIEPEVGAIDEAPVLNAHAMNPVSVLQLARTMGPICGRVLLVGCEPATLGGEEGYMGLSPPVSAAVDEAIQLIEKLIAQESAVPG